MALRLKTHSPLRRYKHVGMFVAVFALAVQGLVVRPIPQAFAAASVSMSPTSLTVGGGTTGTSSGDASALGGLNYSFSFDASKLEAGDSLHYGWRNAAAGTDNALGTIDGETNTGGNPGPHEIGTKSGTLPAGAQVAGLTFYFTNSGTTNDDVVISSIAVTGDAQLVTPAVPTNLSWQTAAGTVIANGGLTNMQAGTASWQDSSQNVDHYVYKYWNDIPANPYKVGHEYAATVHAMSLPGVFNQGEGVHHFTVTACNTAGSCSAPSTTFTLTYDSTAPTGSVTVSGAGQSVQATLSTSEPIQTPAGWTPVDGTTFTQAYGANGSFSVDFADLAGNTGSASFDVTTVDTTAPDVTLDTPVRNADGTYLVTGTTEPGATLALSFDSKTPVAVTVHTDGAWAYTTAVLAAGHHTVTAIATDTYGNADLLGETTSFEVPITPANPVKTSPKLDTGPATIAATTVPLGTPRTSRGLVPVTADSDTTDDDSQASILGTTDTRDEGQSSNVAAVSTSSQGWTLWGVAWYWWLLAAGLLAGLVWFFGARRRQTDSI